MVARERRASPPPDDALPMVCVKLRVAPRRPPAFCCQASVPENPGSLKPDASCDTSPRDLISAWSPRTASEIVNPPPTTSPNPVSASPASCRTPVSSLGTTVMPPFPNRYARLASSPTLNLVTVASAGSSLPPPALVARPERVSTTIASALPLTVVPSESWNTVAENERLKAKDALHEEQFVRWAYNAFRFGGVTLDQLQTPMPTVDHGRTD